MKPVNGSNELKKWKMWLSMIDVFKECVIECIPNISFGTF